MARRSLGIACILVMVTCGFTRRGIAEDLIAPESAKAPVVSDLDIQIGKTVVIMKGATYPSAFRFADGRIAVSSGMGCRNARTCWSADGGRTWEIGGIGPTNATLELGDGEVLSLMFRTQRTPDGKLKVPQLRSKNHWKTVEADVGLVDVPRSTSLTGDDGSAFDGMTFDHGLVRLKNGNLMATMYGNYQGDEAPIEGFPPGLFKYRTIAVFSADNGKTWGSPVTAAYDPAIGQESFCEPDVERMPSGDLLCVMRTGGNHGTWHPLYSVRSSDEGQTWSNLEPIADRGVWPNLCVTTGNVVVCAYGREGNWLTFSTDDGKTWKGAFCFYNGRHWASCSSSYNTVLPVSSDTLLVVYDRLVEGADPNSNLFHHADRYEIVGTFVSVRAVPAATAVRRESSTDASDSRE